MTLVNLDGTAIFGAGSEWFWSMAQFVLVAASILGIYFQLRAQRAATVSDMSAAWEAKLNSEEFMLVRLEALIKLDGRPIEAGMPRAAGEVGDFFERLGYLLSSKHVRSTDVWNYIRVPIGDWWALLEPHVAKLRQDMSNPAIYEWFEALEGEMRRVDVKQLGHALTFDTSPEAIIDSIDALSARLRRAFDARNGTFPMRQPTPEPPTGQSSSLGA